MLVCLCPLLIVTPFTQKYICDLVEDELDLALSMTEQPTADLQAIRDRVSNAYVSPLSLLTWLQATKKFPMLRNYQNLWVVDDFIRAHLKARKQALKREELQSLAATAKSRKADTKSRKTRVKS